MSLRGLGVSLGTTPVLRDVDLDVAPGESLGLFGSNGAGKTTLLQVMATLLRPTAGGGSILGAKLGSPERFGVRPRIGLVGHLPGLFTELSLAENLTFTAKVGGFDANRVPEVLERVGLAAAADRPVRACSHGMQRRAEFARVLLTEPDLLLLDEPHTALDIDASDLVALIVKQVREREGSVVLVSHDRDRVMAMADQQVVLRGGRLER